MTHINQRRDYAAVWTSTNPILMLGEVGWERDTRKAKLGDGTTPWNNLAYAIEPIGDRAPLNSPLLYSSMFRYASTRYIILCIVLYSFYLFCSYFSSF